MKPTTLALYFAVCALSLILSSCSSMRISKQNLDSAEFIRLYNQRGTPGDYWEYKGLRDGKHWLYHYTFKQSQDSIVSVTEKAFIDSSLMPVGFPSLPQKAPVHDPSKVKRGITDWINSAGSKPKR